MVAVVEEILLHHAKGDLPSERFLKDLAQSDRGQVPPITTTTVPSRCEGVSNRTSALRLVAGENRGEEI